MGEVAIREATAADRDVLRRLILESTLQPAGGAARLEPEDDPGLSDDGVVFLAEVEGHPAGYLALREAGPTLHIERLVVAPADQGRRVGHALLDWAEGYGTSRGLERIEVSRTGSDEQALDFYRRRGYLDADGDALARTLTHR